MTTTTEGVKTILYPVKDLTKAKGLFRALVGEPLHDSPYYVGYNVDGQTIGLVPNGVAEQAGWHRSGMTGPVTFWQVNDIRASLQALLDAGAEAQQEVKDVGAGKLTATVKDPDGNVIGLTQNP
ncbi:MAG TPA: VOC family protein [Candidatus Dormibacteraeota bacterium]